MHPIHHALVDALEAMVFVITSLVNATVMKATAALIAPSPVAARVVTNHTDIVSTVLASVPLISRVRPAKLKSAPTIALVMGCVTLTLKCVNANLGGVEPIAGQGLAPESLRTAVAMDFAIMVLANVLMDMRVLTVR